MLVRFSMLFVFQRRVGLHPSRVRLALCCSLFVTASATQFFQLCSKLDGLVEAFLYVRVQISFGSTSSL